MILHSCGTFPFAAPEVLDAYKNKQRKRNNQYTYFGDLADTFSMGVLLFEMCFGLSSIYMKLGWQHKSQEMLLSDDPNADPPPDEEPPPALREARSCIASRAGTKSRRVKMSYCVPHF